MNLPHAIKQDEEKDRYDLISAPALHEMVKVLTFGAKKYQDRNWEKGLKWSRVFGALMRHLWAFWRGEDIDKETNISHLAHAMCCIMFLLHYQIHSSYAAYDDRHLK